MSALPSGTVTFVFSDIEGSTTLLKALGDAYGDVLSGHRKLMRESFTSRGGVEIDTQGDAFFFAFSRARDAVSAAVDAQRAHVAYEWPEGRTVRVRMGLHTGEPAVGGEGYLGIDVVRAARLCTVGRGGQVLLSETTRALLGSTVPQGVAVHALGERRLKDIDEPERVFELDIEGAPTPPPPDGDTAESVPEPAPAPRPAPPPAAPSTPPHPGDWLGRPGKPSSKKKRAKDEWGARFSERIQQRVRQTIEQKLEARLNQVLSEVDVIADRMAEHPDKISERLDESEWCVRSLVNHLLEGAAAAPHLCQDGVRGGGPLERLRVVVVGLEVVLDRVVPARN
jgi:class 3 adenylate cyclase